MPGEWAGDTSPFMTCNYSPTQQNRLCCLSSTTITRAWVVSFLTGPDTNKHPGVPLSHSPSVPLRCSACRALPISGVELPSNICRVPPRALLMALWQPRLWRKGVVVQSEITFPLSSVFSLPTWWGEKWVILNMTDQIPHSVALR